MTEIDETVAEVMENNDLDKETAERVVEIMDDHGVSGERAVKLEGGGHDSNNFKRLGGSRGAYHYGVSLEDSD